MNILLIFMNECRFEILINNKAILLQGIYVPFHMFTNNNYVAKDDFYYFEAIEVSFVQYARTCKMITFL